MRLRDHLRLNPFPATDPANAPARAESKLGSFPADQHVPPAPPAWSAPQIRPAK